MKKHIIDLLFATGLVLSILLHSFSAFAEDCERIQHSVLRLHIPANSDSDADQQTKLALRDYILNTYGAQLSADGDIAVAKEHISAMLPQIENDCNRFLSERGADYSAQATLVNMYFTTRQYENVTLPAGYYDALRITLGSGEGQNWWCIMFPPLCIPVAAEPLCDEELSAFEGAEKIEVRFAVYEWLKGMLD